MKKIIVATIGLVLIATACNKQAVVSPNPTPTPLPVAQSAVYENDYMKITVPSDWVAKQANQPIYVGQSKTPTYQPNPAAVNITKGNYILYINTQASQASGVEGGRFAEIAIGAPSADAVVTVQPTDPCGISESTDTTVNSSSNKRIDWYVSARDKKDWCAVPTNGNTVWYFSYISPGSGYFNYYQPGQNQALVITMSYNLKDVSSFPVKGSAELYSALSQMTSIAQSLVVKQK